MLTIYMSKTCIPKDLMFVTNNEDEFDLNFMADCSRFDDTVKGLIKRIDGSTLMPDNSIPSILTKFNNRLDITYLSTGCKTAINVHLMSEVCFSLNECGNNAIIEILRFNSGTVYLDYEPFSWDDFMVDCLLVSDLGRKRCSTFSDLLEQFKEWR